MTTYLDQTADRKARVFSLSQSFIEQFAGKQPKWGYNGLGYFVYKRTYSRTLEDGSTEGFWQTCQRVVEGVYNIQKEHCWNLKLPWNEPKAQQSAQEMFTRMWEFKFLPPGRGLWAMGTEALKKKNSAILFNCAFTSTETIDVDFAGPFCWLMDMSMLGVGVGGDTRGAGKVKIQRPRYTDKPFVVEDTREGWVELIRVLLNSFVGKGFLPKEIDYSQVRPKGSLLKTFGGVSAGSEPLETLVSSLKRLLMPDDEEPYKITSADIVDIFNYIGKAVVAGGIRRTSEILFGDPEDEGFMNLKQDREALMDRRWASNNSIFATVGMDYAGVAERIATNGEPGILWLDNMRKFARIRNKPNNRDRRAMGSNPCSEITCEDRELCNLVESFPANHESLEDYKRTLKFAYLYAKSVTLIPTHDPRTNVVTMRNRRIGCSQSGIVQAMKKLGRREYLRWCDQGYRYIAELDKIYSEWLCIPRSIKMTAVKPSGSISLLTGSTPGIHFPHSEFYIRNVRIQDTSPLVKACRKAGYPVEPDKAVPHTLVVSFPVKTENFDRGKADVTIWEQFANAADLQREWADNQVSITVTFQSEEVSEIKTCLEVFETKLKGVSLLPLSNHGYEQAPYIEIDEKTYDEMVAKLKPLDLSDAVHEVTDKFCTNDSCEISLGPATEKE
jgi:ribonucleoside-triphosphate reductase (thioredoxin)